MAFEGVHGSAIMDLVMARISIRVYKAYSFLNSHAACAKQRVYLTSVDCCSSLAL